MRAAHAVPLLALLVCAPAPARAGEPGECFGEVDLGRPVSLATATERVPFVKSAGADKACPSAAPVCREKAYLVAGNTVLVSATEGDFACATYVGAKGATRSGWLPRAALAETPSAAIGLDDWAGTWMASPEHTIVITRKGAALALAGDATYGALDPDRVRRGAVNVGSFAVEARPQGASLAFTDRDEKGVAPVYSPDDGGACSVRMRLVPPFLVAESNLACGGMNVTFTGLYRRGG